MLEEERHREQVLDLRVFSVARLRHPRHVAEPEPPVAEPVPVPDERPPGEAG
jgi:hypothetical protein